MECFLANQMFSTTNFPISRLIEEIDTGTLHLPDLQRPFVWERARVRDLFDSIYRGYPAGYFLFWSSPKSIDSHVIGEAETPHKNGRMIVDGQQRLTSLYAVMKAKKVLNDQEEEVSIRIAFNPLTEDFSVANASSDNNPEFISDISELWTGQGTYSFVNDFLNRLASTKEITEQHKAEIGSRIERLHNIETFQFSALELSSELDISIVAEIFQRINSTGIPLNSADFILTLMSVYRVQERHKLEDFAKAARLPSKDSSPSPFNKMYSPAPDKLLRVAVGLGLGRGVLQQAYQVLRGRDMKTQVVSDALREQSFDRLALAQEKVLDITNWHDYLVCVKRAGYRSNRLVISGNNFMYCYLAFLIGKYEKAVPMNRLRPVISRWIFMTALCGRYTGSPETAIEADLRRFREVKDAESFVGTLNQIISNQLTKDYWHVTIPERLDNSSSRAPVLYAYHAALCLLDAKPLFSNTKMVDFFEENSDTQRSPIERHHLFPKAYLRKQGFHGVYNTNQIANFAFLEWRDNLSISDLSPSEYFPKYFSELSAEAKKEASFHHALPHEWWGLDYKTFLLQRRPLIADVIEEGFKTLSQADYHVVQVRPSLDDLLRLMETKTVEFKESARVSKHQDVPENVINEGIIKTVAAFLNSDGGTLGIGITDDGDVVGVQEDLNLKNHDLDAYQNWLITLLGGSVDMGLISRNVDVETEVYAGVPVCLIYVKPSSKPVFANTRKGTDLFYVRAGNTTRVLAGDEMQNFISERF